MVKTKPKPKSKKPVVNPVPRKRRLCPNPARVTREYTADERAAAMAALAANDFAFRRTSRETGIPITTLRQWVKDGVAPVEPKLVAVAVDELKSILNAHITRALGMDPRDFPRASYLDHARAVAILIDKACVLAGNARDIVDVNAKTFNVHVGADGKPTGNLGQLPPGQLSNFLNIVDRLSGRKNVIFAPEPGDPDYDPGIDEPTPAEALADGP